MTASDPTPLFPAETARVQALEWLTPARVRQLEAFGLTTIAGLLMHYPRRHENRVRFDSFPQQESAQAVCVYGVVKKVGVRFLGGRRKMVEVTLQEEEAHALSSTLVCRWFNVHHVQKMVVADQRLVVYGKPKRSGKQIVIDHPDFEVVEEGDLHNSPHFNRITPRAPCYRGALPAVATEYYLPGLTGGRGAISISRAAAGGACFHAAIGGAACDPLSREHGGSPCRTARTGVGRIF